MERFNGEIFYTVIESVHKNELLKRICLSFTWRIYDGKIDKDGNESGEKFWTFKWSDS